MNTLVCIILTPTDYWHSDYEAGGSFLENKDQFLKEKEGFSSCPHLDNHEGVIVQWINCNAILIVELNEAILH